MARMHEGQFPIMDTILMLNLYINYIFISVDTIPPVIACINDITDTVNTGVTGATVTWTEPTATDNSGVVSLTGRTHQPGSFFPVGTTEVTYTFTDGSGNSATCVFNVNVIECKFVVSF